MRFSQKSAKKSEICFLYFDYAKEPKNIAGGPSYSLSMERFLRRSGW